MVKNNDKHRLELIKKVEHLKGELKKIAQELDYPAWTLIDSSEYEPALNLCDTVLKYVPEFRDYKDFSVVGKENPYLHFGNFGNFLVERIEKNSDSDPLVQRAFNFINDSYNNSDDEYVLTMLGTEIFEKLTVSKKTIAVAQKYLQEKAFHDFGKTVEGLSTPPSL